MQFSLALSFHQRARKSMGVCLISLHVLVDKGKAYDHVPQSILSMQSLLSSPQIRVWFTLKLQLDSAKTAPCLVVYQVAEGVIFMCPISHWPRRTVTCTGDQQPG